MSELDKNIEELQRRISLFSTDCNVKVGHQYKFNEEGLVCGTVVFLSSDCKPYKLGDD